MRYNEFDVTLLPAGSSVPTEEFNTVHGFTEDPDSLVLSHVPFGFPAQAHGRAHPGALLDQGTPQSSRLRDLPAVQAHMVAFVAGNAFQVSVQYYSEQPGTRPVGGLAGRPDLQVGYEICVFSGGHLSGRAVRREDDPWPVTIGDTSQGCPPMSFPAFNLQDYQPQNPAILAAPGRIKVLISKGYYHVTPMGEQMIQNKKNAYVFSYVYAPQDVLVAQGHHYPVPGAVIERPLIERTISPVSEVSMRFEGLSTAVAPLQMFQNIDVDNQHSMDICKDIPDVVMDDGLGLLTPAPSVAFNNDGPLVNLVPTLPALSAVATPVTITGTPVQIMASAAGMIANAQAELIAQAAYQASAQNAGYENQRHDSQDTYMEDSIDRMLAVNSTENRFVNPDTIPISVPASAASNASTIGSSPPQSTTCGSPMQESPLQSALRVIDNDWDMMERGEVQPTLLPFGHNFTDPSMTPSGPSDNTTPIAIPQAAPKLDIGIPHVSEFSPFPAATNLGASSVPALSLPESLVAQPPLPLTPMTAMMAPIAVPEKQATLAEIKAAFPSAPPSSSELSREDSELSEPPSTAPSTVSSAFSAKPFDFKPADANFNPFSSPLPYHKFGSLSSIASSESGASGPQSQRTGEPSQFPSPTGLDVFKFNSSGVLPPGMRLEPVKYPRPASTTPVGTGPFGSHPRRHHRSFTERTGPASDSMSDSSSYVEAVNHKRKHKDARGKRARPKLSGFTEAAAAAEIPTDSAAVDPDNTEVGFASPMSMATTCVDEVEPINIGRPLMKGDPIEPVNVGRSIMEGFVTSQITTPAAPTVKRAINLMEGLMAYKAHAQANPETEGVIGQLAATLEQGEIVALAADIAVNAQKGELVEELGLHAEAQAEKAEKESIERKLEAWPVQKLQDALERSASLKRKELVHASSISLEQEQDIADFQVELPAWPAV